MQEVTIYTDGGCLGNPGPGGYGVVLYNGAGTKTAQLMEGAPGASLTLSDDSSVGSGLHLGMEGSRPYLYLTHPKSGQLLISVRPAVPPYVVATDKDGKILYSLPE